jgi:hypothetical protein
MQVVRGTVVGGKIVLDDGFLPDGTEVAVLVAEQDNAVRLPPALQRELEWALAEADQQVGIGAKELFTELRKYG